MTGAHACIDETDIAIGIGYTVSEAPTRGRGGRGFDKLRCIFQKLKWR